MSNIKKLANQTVIYGGTTIVGRLLNYLLVPFHTYIFLDPKNYGVVGEMYAWVALLLVILTYGMETAYFRFSNSEQNRKKVFSTTLWMLLSTSTLFVVLGLCFSQPIADLLKYPSHPEYIRWFVIIVAMDAVSCIPFAHLRGENKAFHFAGIKIANILINVFFNIFFLWFCPLMIRHGIGTGFFSAIYHEEIGVGYIFIANLIASVCQFVLLLACCKNIEFKVDTQLLKRMLKYAFPLLILGLAGIVNETMDRILIKNLSSTDAEEAMRNVGIYSACFKISVIMNLFIQAFRYAAEPFFFNQYKEKDAKEGYSTVMTYFVIVCTFIFLVTTLYLDYLKYFVSERYHVGLPIVPLLLLAFMMLGMMYNLSIWYKLTGQTQFGAYITLGGAAITLIVNFLLIPRIGIMGAAIAHFTTYFCMMTASYFLGQKYYPVPYQLKKIGFYTGLSLLLFVIGFHLLPWLFGDGYSLWLKTLINTLLIAIFAAITYKKECRNLKKIMNA